MKPVLFTICLLFICFVASAQQFTLSGKINRTDFGLTWNAALETGGVMVSEDVRILGELQFVKQA